ncbi:methanol O-anthraniloyltransferase-like [Eucalyptus grandis]|uniref:methanol O-anthraniloyltransferase-like n=1 Tax=Eucalyptus grandis TaxID=71139 RepID=UPI00192F0C33|nr:methanol O-anthraniloyltransferase-like [Eucalyptus grandis]
MASLPPFSPAQLFVNRHKLELISPSRATPRELKLFSDLDDQEGLHFQIPFLFFYPISPSIRGREDPVKVIKEALRKALMYYYPMVGLIHEGLYCKLMVDCTSKGILFVEADADVSLEELGDSVRLLWASWTRCFAMWPDLVASFVTLRSSGTHPSLILTNY